MTTKAAARTAVRRIDVLTATMLLAVSVLVSGCSVIGDIFKAGVWVGIIFVVVIIAIIVGVMRMFSK